MLNNERTLVGMSVYCYRAGGCCAGVTVSALFRHRGRQVTVYDIAAKLPTIDVLRDRCKGLALDGSDLLEILLDDIVDRYVKFAEDYHEIEVAPTVVEHVLAHRPLTDVVVQALNPEVTVAGLREDIAAIGYPIAAA